MSDLKNLIRFFENMLHGVSNELRSRDMLCEALFEDPSLIRNMPASEVIEK